MLYRVTITEESDYVVNLEADNEDEAKEKATDAHTCGMSVELIAAQATESLAPLGFDVVEALGLDGTGRGGSHG